MGNSMAVEKLEQRFASLMAVAQYRLCANNLEMWENQASVVPWNILDRLASFPDDAEAADWLLSRARAQDMMCVIMGYQKLLRRLERDDAKAEKFVNAALQTLNLGEAFHVFALYWFNLPLGYWLSADHTDREVPATY